MTMVADPEVVIVPITWAMIGVSGEYVSTTRTDARLFEVRVPQVVPVQAPDGALPGALHWK
jgi:hypothetical protein